MLVAQEVIGKVILSGMKFCLHETENIVPLKLEQEDINMTQILYMFSRVCCHCQPSFPLMIVRIKYVETISKLQRAI